MVLDDELKELKTNLYKLETDLAISCNTNKELSQQLLLVERKCWPNKQYSSQDCREISGNPEPVQDDDLEDCAFKVFNLPGVIPQWIWQILKLKARPKRTIIKLSKMKEILDVLQRKKKLKLPDIANVTLIFGFHKSKPMFLTLIFVVSL